MRMEELLQLWSQGVVVVGVHCMAVPHVFCTSHTGIWFFSRDICPSWLWTQNLEHSFVNVSFCPIVEDTIVSFMYKQGGEVMVSGKQNWMFSWCDVSFWCGLSCFFSAFCLALSLPVYVLSLPFSFSENVSAPSGLLGELLPIFSCCLMYTLFYSFCWCNHWMISSSVRVSPQGYGCVLSLRICCWMLALQFYATKRLPKNWAMWRDPRV